MDTGPATVGREGMVGLPVFLGAASSPHAAFCQVPGTAVKTTANILRQVLANGGALHRALSRYTQATMVQIAQNVVCNSTHATAQLGVRRQTTSDVARQLQADGLIRYSRGILTITDGPGLERAACSCYGIVKAEFDLITGNA